jgi:iron(III) transport system ATP-binding protein
MKGTAVSAVTTTALKLSYGATAILDGIDLAVRRGETLALLGPSGCGKTTLLRIVAGLLFPTAGRVSIGDTLVADAASGTNVPPERRGLGMVFQDYALWPHLSVAENVAFPLEMRKVGRAERETRVVAALDRVGLRDFGGRNPGQLSGGQQQRVAIARAIVAEPALVLFDEPLSNLDRELRETMVEEIGQLLASLGLTALYVTHDQFEAFTLAARVAVMRRGHVVQLATPQELVDRPADPGVAEFLRLGTVTPVELRDQRWWLSAADMPLAPVDTAGAPLNATSVLIGRNAVRLVEPGRSALSARVVRSQFRGDRHLTDIRLGDSAKGLTVQVEIAARLTAGEQIALRIAPEQLRWFPADTSPKKEGVH